MREGRIERAIRQHLDSNLDEAFSTDDLVAVCYPGQAIERKHRFAVLRASKKVELNADWRSWNVVPMMIFYNAGSVPSTAKAYALRERLRYGRWSDSPVQWDEPERLAKARTAVDEHIIMQHGTDEQRQHLTERREATMALHAARLSVAVAIAKNPASVLLHHNQVQAGSVSELAAKARGLMVENDPDVVRTGLSEIAIALEAMGRELENPLAAVTAKLAA